jgi:hypothetical protein
MAATKDWDRLAEYVRERRVELGLTQEDIRMEGGPSTATMRLIEGALQENYQPATLRDLEKALQWEHGSVRRILSGGEPAERPDPAVHAALHHGLDSFPSESTVEMAEAMELAIAEVRYAIRQARRKYPGVELHQMTGQMVYPGNDQAAHYWDGLVNAGWTGAMFEKGMAVVTAWDKQETGDRKRAAARLTGTGLNNHVSRD